MFAVRVF